jgi:predicted transcriptional regulator
MMSAHPKRSLRHRAVRTLLVKKLLDEGILVPQNIAEEVGVSMTTLKRIITGLEEPNHLKNLHQRVQTKIRVETIRDMNIKTQLDRRDKVI